MQATPASYIVTSLDETILVWITALKDYSLKELQLQPGDSSFTEWSLGQVYQHIIDDTKFFIGQAEASLTDTQHYDMEMHETAKRMFADNGFPGMKLTNPNNDINMPQPQSELILLQELAMIKRHVNSFNVAHLASSKGKAPQPGLGYFTALQWLQFADMHMRHHLRQKQRIDQFIFNGK